jgi:hypothetical protein
MLVLPFYLNFLIKKRTLFKRKYDNVAKRLYDSTEIRLAVFSSEGPVSFNKPACSYRCPSISDPVENL